MLQADVRTSTAHGYIYICTNLSHAAPGRVKGLNAVGLGRADDDQIHQSISWRRPSNHTGKLHYIVKYGQSSEVDRPTHPSVNTATSSNTTVILTLPIPTKRTVYNVWVAAVSDVRQGEYRMTQFTYKSKHDDITNESHYDNDVCPLYNASLQSPVLQRTLQSSTKLVTVYQFSGHLHLTQED